MFVSAEVAPFSKTGGLADVAGALPEALVKLGHELLVVTPWYQQLQASPAPLWIGDVQVPFAGGFESVGVGTLERHGVRYAFVGHPSFARPKLYGYPDDVERFARFSRAAPQVAARVGFSPDVVHANDWHSAFVPMLLQRGWHLPAGFPGLPSLFTVHNVQFQGDASLDETLHWLRLGTELTGSYLNHFGRANAMQAGVGFAQHVTTVSPSYAAELQLPEFGFGLDGTFRSLASKLTGIMNGLDTATWDPANDPNLPRPYSQHDLTGKAAAKAALTARFGLDPARPLLALVSRLAWQKGIDLLLDASNRLLEQGWSLLVLGSGDAELERSMSEMFTAQRGRAAGKIGFDEGLSHLIYAGADALAVPSRFEPCGLSQLIAMRYGTVPVVRATGGLRDSVSEGRTGFLFEPASADGLVEAAARARRAYGQPRWRELQLAGMRQDHSWAVSAARYAELYAELEAGVLPS